MRALTDVNDRDQHQNTDGVRRFIQWLTASGLVGIVLFALQFGISPQAAAVVGVALTIAGAALVVGGLVGFLFGMPRTIQAEIHPSRGLEDRAGPAANRDPAVPTAAASTTNDVQYRANTNLEEISDWLTKILVGVGLTQLVRLPDLLGGLGRELGPALGGSTGSSSFVQATTVYFSVCGFLYGFLWARLEFVLALASTDLDVIDARFRSQLDAQSRSDAAALTLVDRTLNPMPSVKEPSLQELTTALRAASPAARAQVLSITRRARREGFRDRDAARIGRAIPILQALISTNVGRPQHQYYGQLGFALKDQARPDWSAAEAELTKAIEARGPWESQGWVLYEFNRAICRIQQDGEFLQGRRSTADVRDAIAADLRAFDAAGIVLERPEEALGRWRQLNEGASPQNRRGEG